VQTTTATPSSKRPLDVAEVFPEVNEIADEKLRRGVIDVWQDLWSMSSYASYDDVPISPEISYPTKPHNQCVLRMCLAVADEIERYHGVKANRDHLIAAAVLQDASKVVEYQTDSTGKTGFSEIGRQYPHAFMAAHIAILKGIPEAIVHVLLTHTPQSPKFPSTLEGKILYYVDQLDVIAVFKDRWRKELFITK
jgi:hypothetical protein